MKGVWSVERRGITYAIALFRHATGDATRLVSRATVPTMLYFFALSATSWHTRCGFEHIL